LPQNHELFFIQLSQIYPTPPTATGINTKVNLYFPNYTGLFGT